MRRGDIEIRIKGRRFADIDAPTLLQMVSEVAKLWPDAELINARSNYFVLRQRKPPEASCNSTPSPISNTETPTVSPTTANDSDVNSTPPNTPAEPAMACA